MPSLSNKYFYDNIYLPDPFDQEGHIKINNNSISNFRLAKPLIKNFFESKNDNTCPYCKSNILVISSPFRFSNRRGERTDYASLTIWDCLNCSFWKIHQYSWNYDSMVSSQWENLFTSKLKEFDENLPAFFKEEISIKLKQQPDWLYSYNPHNFEKYIAELFKANYDHSEAIHVGGPNDLGVDVYFVNAKKEEWLIQVKRRSKKDATEGISTIIHLIGSMTIKNRKKGIVVSTADRYTTNAVKLVSSMKRKDYVIELVDIGILNRMISKVIPKSIPLSLLKSEQEDITLFKENFPKEFSIILQKAEEYYLRRALIDGGQLSLF